MPFGITNSTNVTMQNITALTNFSGDPAQFFIKANEIIYGGWFYFVMLWVTWFILYRLLQARDDQILNNIMYSGVIVTILSFFLRAIFIVENGVVQGLLTGFQMWMFPLVTTFIIGIVWFIKRN